MPKISVLMPIYKTKENHLRQAIESILAQTFTDFEFLILNDSPEVGKLDEIVNSYKDARIVYLKNENNIGIAESRNKLINMAKGEYLAIMDHDDISLPERFYKQVEFLDINPEYGVVSSNYITIPRNKKSNNYKDDKNIKLLLMKGCAMNHPASMIRKSILIENNIFYKKEFSPAEDYALWCELIPVTKFCNLKEHLFQYRHHRNNTFKRQSEQMIKSSAKVKEMVRAKHPELFREFTQKSTQETKIYLFGLLPILYIECDAGIKTYKLFGLIPITKVKS